MRIIEREQMRREPEDLLERRENGKRHNANRRFTSVLIPIYLYI